jgi:hypothetical protein
MLHNPLQFITAQRRQPRRLFPGNQPSDDANRVVGCLHVNTYSKRNDVMILKEILSELSTRELVGAVISVVLLLIWAVVVLCYPTIMEVLR